MTTIKTTSLRLALLAGVAVFTLSLPVHAKEHAKKQAAKPVAEQAVVSSPKATATKVSSFRPFEAGDVLVRMRGIAVMPEVSSSVSIGGKVEAS